MNQLSFIYRIYIQNITLYYATGSVKLHLFITVIFDSTLNLLLQRENVRKLLFTQINAFEMKDTGRGFVKHKRNS